MFIEEGSPTNSRFTRNFQMKHVDVCLSLCRQSKNCLTTIWNHHNSPRCKTLKILNYVLVDFFCPHLIWILWGNSCCNDMSPWFRTDLRTENYLKKKNIKTFVHVPYERKQFYKLIPLFSAFISTLRPSYGHLLLVILRKTSCWRLAFWILLPFI